MEQFQIQPQQAFQNIFNQVAIEPQASDIWLSAIADIANHVRLKNNPMRPVEIGDETAVIAPSGTLMLTVMVSNEKLEMAVPSGMWRWNG